MAYRLFVDLEALHVLDSIPRGIRHRLIAHFGSLRAAPQEYADYHERDVVGRQVAVCIFGGCAIHYWIDEADQHIKVLTLRLADR